MALLTDLLHGKYTVPLISQWYSVALLTGLLHGKYTVWNYKGKRLSCRYLQTPACLYKVLKQNSDTNSTTPHHTPSNEQRTTTEDHITMVTTKNPSEDSMSYHHGYNKSFRRLHVISPWLPQRILQKTPCHITMVTTKNPSEDSMSYHHGYFKEFSEDFMSYHHGYDIEFSEDGMPYYHGYYIILVYWKDSRTFPARFPYQSWGCGDLSRYRLPPVINHSTLAYVCHYPGADCHQSSTIPPWPMCVTIQGQTATSHQPFHPGLCVSLSRGRLPPVINHSTLAYVCHYPGADCHQSSTIPPWPMCVTIQGQTATSHQPFHPGLCVALSRGRLPPVITHSTLAYVCHYPGADCHQSSTIPPWPMWFTIQGQTATSHQPFHPGLCVPLSRCRLPPTINHSTLTYVCHYPGADCHQSSTIPPWPMCATIQVQTATNHQPFHPGLCVSLSRGRLPPVINHSTLAYVCHYPGADCHQSSTIPPWPMCVTIQVQTATSHQPFHPGLCVALSRGRLPPVINHSTLACVCHYPGADCHQSSTIPPWPMCVTIQGPPRLSDFISQQIGQNSESLANI